MSLPPFANEPLLDLADPTERERMRRAVAAVRSQLGQSYPLAVSGHALGGSQTLVSRCPADSDCVVGEIPLATAEDAGRAVAAARAAFPAWAAVPGWERAAVLLRAGDILRQRRRELLGWLAFEVGKNFNQGDGEVAEAIDHFEWNARQLLGWERREIQPIATEINDYRYRPLGVGVVISPWNFPTTLPLGMTVAAIAAGNSVILKPAEAATVIAVQLMRVLEEAGVPEGVVTLVPGTGPEAGAALVRHPDVHFVAFVGSKPVGTAIHAAASGLVPGQRQLKRVMTEMGGKNATIVTAQADLEWAVGEITQSVLGYQGQKCSATSRLICTADIHDRVLEALLPALDAFAADCGPATDNHAFGPLISRAAREKVLTYAEAARSSGMLLRTGAGRDPGHTVTPTVVADVDLDADIAQEEVFGPFLTVHRVRDLEEAVAAANHVGYALTGALFSRDPRELAYAQENLEVGNLYLNRSSTGAMAGVHPFGGHRLSGTGPKVGGPDYLSFFLRTQAVTQKVRYPCGG
ncbi:MAG TPA: aldehyde dehydrogenase family protein [Verrucomicrobiae bacterium]|nr:aldehyde dehydrogenase family protein [Verrucomicrobiae bacterium]